MAENRKLVKLRAHTEGLSMEDRADKLHSSFRRFILRESCLKKRYLDRMVIEKEADI